VDNSHVIGDGHALRHDEDNNAPCPDVDRSAVLRGGGAIGEARLLAEGRLQGRGNARQVHSMMQNPYQDIVAQCGMANVRAAKGGPATALQGVGIEG
jgi:hypothetical protein